mmetsp:Transcript_5853/g.13870  ORF Transcript_5853/g.13870 Transcript_5853/m.13870 type:complete len:578 (-) Transcript_5853:645-2378(-)
MSTWKDHISCLQKDLLLARKDVLDNSSSESSRELARKLRKAEDEIERLSQIVESQRAEIRRYQAEGKIYGSRLSFHADDRLRGPGEQQVAHNHSWKPPSPLLASEEVKSGPSLNVRLANSPERDPSPILPSPLFKANDFTLASPENAHIDGDLKEVVKEIGLNTSLSSIVSAAIDSSHEATTASLLATNSNEVENMFVSSIEELARTSNELKYWTTQLDVEDNGRSTASGVEHHAREKEGRVKEEGKKRWEALRSICEEGNQKGMHDMKASLTRLRGSMDVWLKFVALLRKRMNEVFASVCGNIADLSAALEESCHNSSQAGQVFDNVAAIIVNTQVTLATLEALQGKGQCAFDTSDRMEALQKVNASLIKTKVALNSFQSAARDRISGWSTAVQSALERKVVSPAIAATLSQGDYAQVISPIVSASEAEWGFSFAFVHLLGGKDLPDKDIIGSSDPYVILHPKSAPAAAVKSAAIPRSIHPFFDETIPVMLPGDEREIVMKVFDKDVVLSDDDIGEGVINCSDLQHGDTKTQWVQLTSKERGKFASFFHRKRRTREKPAGRVKVEVTLVCRPILSE